MSFDTATLLTIAESGAICAGIYFGYKLVIKPAMAVESVVGDTLQNVGDVAVQAAHTTENLGRESWETANNFRKNVICQYTPAKFWDPLKACGDVRHTEQAGKQKGSCVQNDPRGDGLLCQDTGRRHTNTADNESAVDYGTSFDAATGYGRSFDAAT